MEMLEHPDITRMMRYGTLEETARRKRRPCFLNGFVYGGDSEDEAGGNDDDEEEGFKRQACTN
ncbi:MAG: hypothetical protein IKL74_05510 [Clostridia bacterium]|nr:hypothetical protein [Clostridia bacterium]